MPTQPEPETPTPRTDAESRPAMDWALSNITMQVVDADFARQLERELAEKDREWEVAARDAGLYRGTLVVAARTLGCEEHMVDHEVGALKAALAGAEQQLHALRWVCGTTDANRFETALDRANIEIAKLKDELQRRKDEDAKYSMHVLVSDEEHEALLRARQSPTATYRKGEA